MPVLGAITGGLDFSNYFLPLQIGNGYLPPAAPFGPLRCRPTYYAFAVSDSQMLILPVSGIKNRPSTKHIAGPATGQITANPKQPFAGGTPVVMDTNNPPQ